MKIAACSFRTRLRGLESRTPTAPSAAEVLALGWPDAKRGRPRGGVLQNKAWASQILQRAPFYLSKGVEKLRPHKLAHRCLEQRRS